MTNDSSTAAKVITAAAFARKKHDGQTRKGAESEPYFFHVLDVASILAACGATDETLLTAALLHDTIEDTRTTPEELAQHFGPEVAALVLEVSDDKSLEKAVRKELQVQHAPSLSPSAKRLKIADKIANVRDVGLKPAKDWSKKRRREYIVWASQVVDGCRGVDSGLEDLFDETARIARDHVGADEPRD